MGITSPSPAPWVNRREDGISREYAFRWAESLAESPVGKDRLTPL